MACSCTVPVRTQLRRPSVLGRRAPRAAPAPRRGAQAAAAPPPPLDPHTLPRRALLAAAFATLAAPPRAVGSPFDDLLAAKRRTNAKFLTGPIILSRLRLKDSEALPAAEARQARAPAVSTAHRVMVHCTTVLWSCLVAQACWPTRWLAPWLADAVACRVCQAVNKAALDCLTIESGNLQAYSNYREARGGRSAAAGIAPELVAYADTVLDRCARSASWRAASRRAPRRATRRGARPARRR